MKKLSIIAILSLMAAAFVVAIVSCKKDKENELSMPEDNISEISFDNINGIHVKVQYDSVSKSDSLNSWLYFQSKSDFELAISSYCNANDSILTSFENILAFPSMRSMLTSDQREAIEIEDDLLATFLSPNGTIQIGNYIFRIDVLNDSVLVFDQSNSYSSGLPQVFSVDDEIFDVLEGNKGSEEKGCTAKNKEKGISIDNTKVDMKVVYQKAGIYFSLQSKIKKRTYGGAVELYLSCPTGSSYKRNNDSNTYLISSNNLNGGNHSYHYRPYSGCKKLVNFHFTVGFLAKTMYENTGWYTLQIHCGH